MGPTGHKGRGSSGACQEECLSHPLCNLFNYREHPPSCDLRRCLDASRPSLRVLPDCGAYAVIRRSEADERVMRPHDGYVLFGAPNRMGQGGLLYGGCRGGPEIPAAPGVLIEIA